MPFFDITELSHNEFEKSQKMDPTHWAKAPMKDSRRPTKREKMGFDVITVNSYIYPITP